MNGCFIILSALLIRGKKIGYEIRGLVLELIKHYENCKHTSNEPYKTSFLGVFIAGLIAVKIFRSLTC